jgi:hypothetical protein
LRGGEKRVEHWSAAAASRSIRDATESRASGSLMRHCMDFTLGAIAERRVAARRRRGVRYTPSLLPQAFERFRIPPP